MRFCMNSTGRADHGPEWVHAGQVDVKDLLAGHPEARRPAGNCGTKHPRKILNILAAFDIETSNVLPDQAALYHWQMQIRLDRPTIWGTTWEELRSLFDKIARRLSARETLIVYVHNLSFEFCFLRNAFEITGKDVFALSSRKVAKCRIYDGKIEFRCSYVLTNMGLGAWTKRMGAEHAKCSADAYDHQRIRYPWTELTEEELEYCRNDVLGLLEALQVQLRIHGDTLATVPLTSTGYVRRDVKRVMANWSFHGLQALQPSIDTYVMLREAFRGGNTHANRYYAGQILQDVSSMDRSSSYPDVLINHMFPMRPFTSIDAGGPDDLHVQMEKGYALLIRARFENIRLLDPFCGCPYISHSKTRGCPIRTCSLDNGRVLWAPHLEMTMTDVDWNIVEKQYVWDSLTIIHVKRSKYGWLPDLLVQLIISYYRAKTELKGVAGQELFYNKAKALLNSIYGLEAQDPCKLDTIFDGVRFQKGEEDIKGKLARAAKHPYGGYQLGVWTTAWARYELQRAIDQAGDKFVYADTDSVKFIGDLDLSEYNRERVNESLWHGAYADDPAGVRHYMGVYENDGSYDRFVTLGAKKYAYETNGKLHITVAGVGKEAGAAELQQAGGLDAFREGFTFSGPAGGLKAAYNDLTDLTIELEGHRLHIGPNICLTPTTYTLGLTADYKRILEDPLLFEQLAHDYHISNFIDEVDYN